MVTISAAATVANAKSKSSPNPVLRYRPAMMTPETATASVPQVAPRRASGPGRIAAHCRDHQPRAFGHQDLKRLKNGKVMEDTERNNQLRATTSGSAI